MIVSTGRLRLRPCRLSDVDAVMAYRARPDVARYLRGGVWPREHCEQELATHAAAPFSHSGDALVMLAETLDAGQVVGEVGLVWLANPPNTAEVGYVFNPAFGGQGLATEAVRATVAVAFEVYGFELVIAKTDEDNRASRALCDRVGMALVVTKISEDGRDVPECTYGVTHEQHSAQCDLRRPPDPAS